MTIYITVIDSEGDISAMWTTGAIPNPVEGTWEEDSSKTIVHLDGSLEDQGLYRRTHYYKDGSFVSREAPPSDYYIWKDEAWLLDSAQLFVSIRQERNQRLYACDWTQLSDAGLSDVLKAAWVDYRIVLRNVPADNSGATNLDEVLWPTAP